MVLVLRDKKGFSLVEVMIALVVSLLVFLALMQTALVGIDSNMTNILRDEAVRIAEERMNEARNTLFDSLSSDAVPQMVTRNFRNIAAFSYTTNMNVNVLNVDLRQVDINVQWTWKGEPYNHTISTIVRR